MLEEKNFITKIIASKGLLKYELKFCFDTAWLVFIKNFYLSVYEKLR